MPCEITRIGLFERKNRLDESRRMTPNVLMSKQIDAKALRDASDKSSNRYT